MELLGMVAVLLVLLAIAFATGVLGSRCKEGLTGQKWSFEGDADLMDKSDETAKKHGMFIYKKCSTGMLLQTMQENEDWDYLSKYRESDAKEVCKWGIDGARKGGVQKMTETKGCKKQCTHPTLNRTRPCENAEGNKCCKIDGDGKLTNCVAKDDSKDYNADELDYKCSRNPKRANCDPGSNGSKDTYCWWGTDRDNEGMCCKRPWSDPKDCKKPKSGSKSPTSAAFIKNRPKPDPEPAPTNTAASSAASVPKPSGSSDGGPVLETWCWRYDNNKDKVVPVSDIKVKGTGESKEARYKSAYESCNKSKDCKGFTCIISNTNPGANAFKNVAKGPTEPGRMHTWGNCRYSDTVQPNEGGAWVCPKAFPVVISQNDLTDQHKKYQCTTSGSCADLIRSQKMFAEGKCMQCPAGWKEKDGWNTCCTGWKHVKGDRYASSKEECENPKDKVNVCEDLKAKHGAW